MRGKLLKFSHKGLITMKTNLLISTFLIALPLSASLLAAAPDHRPGPGMMLERMDTDGDGQITRTEYETAHGTRFSAMDTNNDGALTADEMNKMRQTKREEMRQRRFDRMDTDGNGQISEEEFNTQGSEMFSSMDANQDGTVSQSEIENWRPMKMGHRQP